MAILIKGLEMPKGDGMLCINIYPDGKVCIDFDLKCTKIAEAVELPPKWIPCSERLPEENDLKNHRRDGIVLVLDKNWNKRCEERGYGNGYGYALAKLVEREWFVFDDYVNMIKPTHWMPLPEPTKEEV